ncbi:MAG: peptidoglycan binding domain-containing protein, partial [Candidatus Portnoybacteria bacterium]|nr:peptidoglycan binding domain-containing protein [Candidatus Portnoybacteria bacterium]
MKFFSWKIGRRFGIAILAAIAILVLFSGGLLAANQNRIIYGAQIAGLSLGGRSFSAATDELKTKIAAAKEAKIEISGNGQKWQIALTEFGLNIDEAASCQTISLLGRQNNFFTNISEQLTAFFTKQPVAAVFSFNPNQFNKALANFSSLETEPQNAILKYDASNDSLEVTAEKAGLKINSQKLLADLANRAEN